MGPQCPACHSTNTYITHEGGSGPMLKCMNCGYLGRV